MDLQLQIEKISLISSLNFSPNTFHVFTFVKLSTSLLRYNKLEKPERFHRTLGVEKNGASRIKITQWTFFSGFNFKLEFWL